MGRKVYGAWLQVADDGWKRTWAKPFAALAVIEPVWPEVSSWRSPEPVRRVVDVDREHVARAHEEVVDWFGVKVAARRPSGLGGACGARSS